MRARTPALATTSILDAHLPRTQQTSLLRICCAAAPSIRPRRSLRHSSPTSSRQYTTTPTSSSLFVSTEARHNEIGVQQVSKYIHPQIFSTAAKPARSDLVDLSKDHLKRHNLLGTNSDASPPIGFDLPALHGQSLDEHFHKLGMDAAEPYLSQAKAFAACTLPPKPRKWVKRAGWTKYYQDGSSEAVDAPQENMLSFDIEVMWRETSFPAMACAASDKAWYAWLSPWLLGESNSDIHLIPLGDPEVPKIVVGHNIGYDRARVLEEYDLKQSKTAFLDTMSLHVAVNGMCSRQRPTWMMHRKARETREEITTSTIATDLESLIGSRQDFDQEEELWVGRSSVNSLRDVAHFHCGITIDKQRREYFGELDRRGIVDKYEELLDYCAADVDVTHRVFQKVFPLFLETCPHPVSFAALRHFQSEMLPVDKSWERYLTDAEATYVKLSQDVQQRLEHLAAKALENKDKTSSYENDPWLQQLDWSGQTIRMVKGKKKGDPPRPAARQKKPGMPKWYKDLFASDDSPINLTVRTRIAPLLLRLAWDGYPLFWSDVHGWVFRVPRTGMEKYEASGSWPADMSEETQTALRDDHRNVYYKLPHKDGPQARCASPLAKAYLQFFENGTLSSEYAYAKEALEMNASCSYWISARDRIRSQIVVYDQQIPGKTTPKDMADLGYILPQIIPMGTITRRAVENTWLTASNAKKNRVGSELKSMVKAPAGYSFVGADVDSEELWIASLVGDASFGIHGGNAIGFMTLEGTKSAGTEFHSRTASILGISRNDAKIFNYGRIYGAGLKFAQTLLKQFNPSLSDTDVARIAGNLYRETKGQKTNRKVLRDRSFWRGGTESFVFNKLEDFAEQERPRTPVLGAGITEALMRRFISKGGFMTSRINWAIQSSGVDYLHLLVVGMDYLIRRYNLDARLVITVHDEIRYLVKNKDKYRAAMALQVANVWTRAMFSQQMGINDLPQSCAYFSAIDIDHVLRKEVDMDCITPSHRTPIPPGESLDMIQLLQKGEKARLDPAITPKDPPQADKYAYTPRVPVMASLQTKDELPYLRAQITNDDAELRAIIKEVKPAASTWTKRATPHDGAPKTRRKSAKQAANDPSEQQPSLMEVDDDWGTIAWPGKASVQKKHSWSTGGMTKKATTPAFWRKGAVSGGIERSAGL